MSQLLQTWIISLDRVYANLRKSLSPSSSTKHQKKPDNDTFVPMYPYVEERIHEMQQRRINACARLPADHPLQPPMIEPLQYIPADAEVVGEPIGPESANNEVSLSPSKPTTQTSDPSVVQDLINHYSGKLPGFEPNIERASEIASSEVTSESSQQQEPNLQMASNTCTDLIIHPVFQPQYIHATRSNISLGIAWRNLANQKSFASENLSFFLEDYSHVVQPLNVAAPSDAILIDLDSDEEESIMCDQPSTSSHNSELINPFVVTDISFTDASSSYNQLSSTIQTTNVSSPPTLLLDSIILKEVCENIFKDLNKLVKSRSNLIHNQDYVSEWTSLRERVNDMMCELQKLCLDAHDKALVELRDWFKEVAQNMEEININRNQKLYLSDTPTYMDASSIIS